MTQFGVFKNNPATLTVAVLQAILPGIVATVSLYVCAVGSGLVPDDLFYRLMALVFFLGVIVLQPPKPDATQLPSAPSPVTLSVLMQWLVLLFLLLVVGYTTKTANVFSRQIMIIWAVATPPVLIFTYVALNWLMRSAMAHPDTVRKAVFVGYNDLSLSLAARLRADVSHGTAVSGFFDDRGAERLGVNSDFRLLGTLPDLADHVRQNEVDVIFIALPIRHIARVMNLLDDLRDTTASLYYVPDIFVYDLVQARSSAIGGIPVVAMCETPFYGYRGIIKRCMDLVISLFAVAILSPLMLLIALLVKSTPGPVIFRQRRYGLDGHQIEVFKFRTMTVMEDGQQVLQATRDDQRVTGVGRILRRYSLDELPQLFNVIQGNMSLVGPRPHAIAHNEQYRKVIKGYMIRHKVLPGMTGLAQVSGCRGEISQVEDMEKRLAFDLEYLRQWTPLLDVYILLLTVLRMFGDKRAY